MNVGNPLINTGQPIPEEEEEPVVDQTDIPTQRPYRFSGYTLNQQEIGIYANYKYRRQPMSYALRASYTYTPKTMNP